MMAKITYVLVFILLTSSQIQITAQEVLSIDQINTAVSQDIMESQRSFNWKNVETSLLWSAISHSDSLVFIGFKPDTAKSIRLSMHEIDSRTADWFSLRQELREDIHIRSEELSGMDFGWDQLFLHHKPKKLPYLLCRIVDHRLLSELLLDPRILYIEPANYIHFESEFRSGEGCGSYNEILDPLDYEEISPDAVQSWHHFDHYIDTAWTKCNKGEGIWISIMDTGISEDNPKFNDDFDEGESAGRFIEKNGYYQGSSWVDGCGHGTAMAGLATAPRGYDDSPAGIAYRANLITNRIANDVLINGSAEIDALADALTDAGDDSRVNIISMSIGDVFSHGPVEDAVLHAYNQGKLMFAAAGTSTIFTNWFGVVFPADMDETSAVTGIVEGSNFTECDNCHYGSEVDFSIYMERSSSGNRTPSTSLESVGGNYNGYVGGSSSATASMAGIAALVWANDPDLSRDQLLNRLIQTSSAYPNKDDDFGWGAINACEAVDTSYKLPCASAISSNITMEITQITFPEYDDGFFDDMAEWVVIINDKSYYFNVPEAGATANPSVYNDESICDAAPIIIELGTTICGDATIDIDLETHEDDAIFSNCNYQSGDDERTISVEEIMLSGSTFSQSKANVDDFVFEYVLYCEPTLVAVLGDDSPKCPGDTVHFSASPINAETFEFFHDSNLNDILETGEKLYSGNSYNYSTNMIADGDRIGLVVTADDGCTDTTVVTINMISPDYSGMNALMGTLNSIADYESNESIHSVQILDSLAKVDYDSQSDIELQAGFELKLGAQLKAFIDGCNDGDGGINE